MCGQDPGSQFRHQTEDGRVVQTSLDLASVPLKGGVLRSGARARIPVQHNTRLKYGSN